MQHTFETRRVTFTIFNRKELPKTKVNAFIEKYKKYDSRDVEKAFFNEMSPAIDSSRGYYSRYVPSTALTYKGCIEDESLAAIGTLIKRPLVDIVDETIALCAGSSANGYINLKNIDWSVKEAKDEEARLLAEQEAVAEMEEENEEVANEKLIPIEAKAATANKQSLTVKK